MQQEPNAAKIPLTKPNSDQKSPENLHCVIIADHYGIDTAFDTIKSKIRQESNSFLTLIYSIKWLLPTPLYQAELELLERRFPARLITNYVFNFELLAADSLLMNQQVLEVTINSDISEQMNFQLYGSEELCESAIGRLLYLGININQISSHIFK